jgi:hypothetical protein
VRRHTKQSRKRMDRRKRRSTYRSKKNGGSFVITEPILVEMLRDDK